METIIFGNDQEVQDVRADLPDRAPGYGRREAGDVDLLLVHHDGSHFDRLDAAAELVRVGVSRNYHMKRHGWPGLSYHFYVFPSGRVYYTGDWATVRYHTAGEDDPNTPQVISRWNERGIAVCLAGNFSRRRPTPGHLLSVKKLLANIQYTFAHELPIAGHRDKWSTSCPGGTWELWRGLVRP